MRSNRPVETTPVTTHEGGTARRVGPYTELRRSTLAALLFEDMFYEKGSTHGARVRDLVPRCRPEEVARLAVECRTKMYLRHMPLFLVRELARTKGNGGLVADTLATVIERPDELAEYLAIYWAGQADKDKDSLSAGSKRGLARALKKFDASTLAKYDREHEYKLKDVLRLVHAKPDNKEQGEVFGKLLKGELESPDTWEVALSSGKDKKETFERLLREKKLGGMAFLRNLRNMIGAGVDKDLMSGRFAGGFGKVLPFRFVAALRYAPQFVREMDKAMQASLTEFPKLKGTTGVLVDVSGSMDAVLSGKSEMLRLDVAGGLAVLVSAIAERPRVFTFSDKVVEVPPFAGLALIDTIKGSQQHRNTYLGEAVKQLAKEKLDRLIVITDEQSHDKVPNPATLGYMINVGAYANGVGYGPWVHIDGWSERILDFIYEYESESN